MKMNASEAEEKRKVKGGIMWVQGWKIKGGSS
jgi:hypothetical protein